MQFQVKPGNPKRLGLIHLFQERIIHNPQIIDSEALITFEMIMRLRIAIISDDGAILDRFYQSRINELVEIPVHRSQTDIGKYRPGPIVNPVRGGMGGCVLNNP